MSIWKKAIFIILIAVYLYFRLGPILNHTVPYTYDQGRDFLKASEMVENLKPTFIGPTTGIMGLFHGAWWYYLLVIPRLLFNGLPIGYYYFMFALSLLANLAFFFFIKKEFDDLTALFYLSLISASPYLIPISFTAANNAVVPNILLLFIAVSVILLKKKKLAKYWLFILGLTLGFVFEFEVAFGMFLIPVFFITASVIPLIRQKIYNLKSIPLIIIGILIPFLPRALFELKNHFLQSKTIIGFITAPKLFNPKPYNLVFIDRIGAFMGYLKSIPFGEFYPTIIFLSILTATAFFVYRKKEKTTSQILTFFLCLTLFLFLISLVYRDNFWSNYFEGIQYFFIFIFLLGYSIFSKQNKVIATVILLIFIGVNGYAIYNNLSTKPVKKIYGLAEQEAVFNYVQNKTDKNDFCLRIYTPPVIPHTYIYLMNYYSRVEGYKISSYDYRNNKCFYIIESDPYRFRVTEWRKDNTPKNAVLTDKKVVTPNVTVEEWTLK